MKKYFEAGIEQEEKMSNLDIENMEEGLEKGYKIEFGKWNRGGFSADIFVEYADTEEEAIRIGTERYTKGAGKAVYVWSPNGELVLERRDDIDIDQSYIDGFHDALKSLAPSFDAEEDMHMSGKPWAEDSLIGTPYSDLATEEIAYEAGKKAAEAVADDIERMCAEEKAMKEEEEEDYPF